MSTILKTYDIGQIEFRHGRFDKWAVVFVKKDGKVLWPKDTEYFSFLKEMGNMFGKEKVYGDFIDIYDKTTKEIDDTLVERITDISKNYGKFAKTVDIVLSVIYFAMIAEEQKAHSILGKRIKRLGLHNIFVLGNDVEYSANFMRGKKWRELDKMCSEGGF